MRKMPEMARSVAALCAGVLLGVMLSVQYVRRGEGSARRRVEGPKSPSESVDVAKTSKPRSGSNSSARNVARNAAPPPSQVRVGVLRLRVATNWRDTVKNDILVEKTIGEVAQTLVILVVGRDKHEGIRYTSALYNLCWDAACLQKKPQLDVKILSVIANEAAMMWDELLMMPGLNTVFGDEEAINIDGINAQRMAQTGLCAVSYHSLAIYTSRYLKANYHYFEDERVDLREHGAVLLGGTFDHLHNGHKKLLCLALSICKRLLIVGITGEEMLKNKKHAHLIQTLEQRRRAVAEFVAFVKPTVRVEFTELSDPYGPALTVPGPAAIVMSTETLLAAETINSMRNRHGLLPLDVYVCLRSDASTLSSSFIRQHLAQERMRK